MDRLRPLPSPTGGVTASTDALPESGRDGDLLSTARGDALCHLPLDADGLEREPRPDGTRVDDGLSMRAAPPEPGGADSLMVRRAVERAAFERFRHEMPLLNQGSYNSCGTTSLAMVLEYYGVPANFRIIDDYIRPYPGPGTASVPGDLVSYARAMGLRAVQHSAGSLEELASHVRAGRPCTVLLNFEDSGNPSAMAHYLNVIGVERDDTGEITTVQLRNPWGRDETLAATDFWRMWSNVRIIGKVPAGRDAGSAIGHALGMIVPTYDRTYVVYDRGEAPSTPGASIGEGLRNSPTNTLMGGVNQLAAGVGAIGRGHPLAGAGQMTAGVINTIGGGAAMVVGNLIGRNIEQGGEALMGVGRELLDGAWHEKAGGGLAWLFGGILKAVGWLLSLVGGVMGWVTKLVSKPFSFGAERRAESEALARQILDDSREHGELDRDEVLRRASAKSKAAMLAALLPLVTRTSDDEQLAALRVLRAAQASDELSQIVAAFERRAGDRGGAHTLADRFTGESRIEVCRLLGLPESTPDGTELRLEPALEE